MSESQESNGFWNNCLTQQSFLREVLRDLETASGRERLTRQMDEVRRILLESTSVFVGADLEGLEEPEKPWQESPLIMGGRKERV